MLLGPAIVDGTERLGEASSQEIGRVTFIEEDIQSVSGRDGCNRSRELPIGAGEGKCDVESRGLMKTATPLAPSSADGWLGPLCAFWNRHGECATRPLGGRSVTLRSRARVTTGRSPSSRSRRHAVSHSMPHSCSAAADVIQPWG